MRIIKPSVEFITPIRGNVILSRIEECGRVCYKSEDKIGPNSKVPVTVITLKGNLGRK